MILLRQLIRMAIDNRKPRKIHHSINLRCFFCGRRAEYFVSTVPELLNYEYYYLCEEHKNIYEEMRTNREELLRELTLYRKVRRAPV